MISAGYEDLTVNEMDNVIKKQLIAFQRKNRVYNDVDQAEKVAVPDGELESKKNRFIELFDKTFVLNTTLYTYFDVLGNPLKLRFLSSDRVPRFFDSYVLIKSNNKHLQNLLQSILNTIPRDDPFSKKIKKRVIELHKLIADYYTKFKLKNPPMTTKFFEANMAVSKKSVDVAIHNIVEGMEDIEIIMIDLLEYLDSIPRSGQGMYTNMDTSEYIIPKRYM